MFYSCKQQKLQARKAGWLCMIVLMVGSFASVPQIASASCGDYLHHRFGVSQNDGGLSSTVSSFGILKSRELTKNRSVTPVPAQKRCYSCRGATMPVSAPVVPSQVRVEYQATMSEEDNCLTSSFSILLGDYLPSISEGAYPSLLRPPIA